MRFIRQWPIARSTVTCCARLSITGRPSFSDPMLIGVRNVNCGSASAVCCLWSCTPRRIFNEINIVY